MKVLKVIHGFPPDYMAGSEVYSYHLVKELKEQNIEVFVYTRVENEFDENYKIYDEVINDINVRRINKPKRDYLYEDKFFDEDVDKHFTNYLKEIKPDIVHFGHLSHLSTNLIKIVHEFKIPIVYTIHDFWLYCVKGQLINENGEICEGPNICRCLDCSPYVVNNKKIEVVAKHMKDIISYIDVFISPSKTLRDFFIKQGISPAKIKYYKYGFNKEKIKYQKKIYSKKSKINFGFMGRIIPTKGIKVLVEAFTKLNNEMLSIYGSVGKQKRFLETDNIRFRGPFNNDNINDVLNDIDVLIVPSIWYENAPLVMQEAFLAGIPVLTSNIGGMKELVEDGVNGFLFKVGDSKDLIDKITSITSNPEILNTLNVDRDSVVDIKDDAAKLIKVYNNLLNS
ncbi:MAG: hypothetical protein CSA15_08150 [Candidatus Delongbacteria bacterium]|nr:MAG: hypothetical protein CSA15_08150 [Candidatus Delongbacteria bacterium]